MLRERKENYYNNRSKNLKEFQINDKVRIQNEETNKWDRIGKIIEIGRFRKYRIEMSNGRKIWRNRRFLRENRSDQRDQIQFQRRENPVKKRNDRTVTFNLETQNAVGPNRGQSERGSPQRKVQPQIEEQQTNDVENQGYGRRRQPTGFYRKLAGLDA